MLLIEIELRTSASDDKAVVHRPNWSHCARIASFSSLMASRNFFHSPPAQALPDAAALPSGLFGPVDCCHGFHCLIASLCRLRRSGVHPLFFCIFFVRVNPLLFAYLYRGNNQASQGLERKCQMDFVGSNSLPKRGSLKSRLVLFCFVDSSRR